jgi:insertion element IS1 protein InsB
LQVVPPEHVTVEMCRSEELDQRRGLTSELDEMWSYVRCKANPRWLWHAIDHHTGTVLAYVFGRRKDDVFLKLQQLLEPFGITKFYTDGWGAYERHLDTAQHQVGKENTQKIESKHITLRTRIKR